MSSVSRANPRSTGVDGLAPRGSRGRRTRSPPRRSTSATNASATAKWAVTHQGLSSVRTTMPPRTAWPITSGNAATAGQRIAARAGGARQATTAVDDDQHRDDERQGPVRELDQRVDRAGREEPAGVHAGHVEHPSPEPVPRTSPPTANSTIVAAAVASGELLEAGHGVMGRAAAHDSPPCPRSEACDTGRHDRRPDPRTAGTRPRLRERGRRTCSTRSFRRGARGDGRGRTRRRRSWSTRSCGCSRAGGKRLRPAFCYWGYRAAGGPDGEPIVRARAALELLHTMALVHDDLMDGAASAAACPRAPSHFADEARGAARRSGASGRSLAILAGDLAAVLAERLLPDVAGSPPTASCPRSSGITGCGWRWPRASSSTCGRARTRSRSRSRAEDRRLHGGGPAADRRGARRRAAERRWRARGVRRPLGEAFQLRDDVHDGDARPAVDARPR